jgi:integrase
MAKKRPGIYRRPDRGNAIYIEYTDRSGQRRKQRTEAQTFAEAEKLRSAILAREEQAKILGTTPAGDDSFESVAERYLEYQRPRLSLKAYQRAEAIVRQHLCPFFKGKIADLRPVQIDRYIAARSLEVSAHSVHKEFHVLKKMFRLAVKWEVVPVSPAMDISSPKTPEGRVRYLQPPELKLLLDNCPAWLKPIVLLAVATGMRRGEILSLRYMDVSREQSRAYLPKTKSGQPRGVPLNELAQMALDAVWNVNAKQTDRIFAGATADKLSMAFRRAASKAKIEDFRFHDLRHTAASWLAMSGADIRAIADILGHADIRMTRKYAHLSPKHVQDAVEKLDAVFMPEVVKDEPKLLTVGEDAENVKSKQEG